MSDEHLTVDPDDLRRVWRWQELTNSIRIRIETKNDHRKPLETVSSAN